MSKVRKMISLLTLSINIHLNIEQTFLINTSQVISSFQTFEYQSLANKTLQQIHFPSKFSSNLNQFQKISLRVNYDFATFDLKLFSKMFLSQRLNRWLHMEIC